MRSKIVRKRWLRRPKGYMMSAERGPYSISAENATDRPKRSKKPKASQLCPKLKDTGGVQNALSDKAVLLTKVLRKKEKNRSKKKKKKSKKAVLMSFSSFCSGAQIILVSYPFQKYSIHFLQVTSSSPDLSSGEMFKIIIGDRDLSRTQIANMQAAAVQVPPHLQALLRVKLRKYSGWVWQNRRCTIMTNKSTIDQWRHINKFTPKDWISIEVKEQIKNLQI